MNLLIAALVCLVIYIIYRLGKWYFCFIRPLTIGSASLPFPPKHWLLGNLINHPGVCEGCMTWWSDAAARCGSIFRLFHGLEPQLYLSHPEAAKEILRSSEPKPLNIPGYGALLPWIGKGLLLSDGAEWHRNRHLLTPAFHFEMLKNYLKVFNATADKLVQKGHTLAKKAEPFDIFPPAGLFTLDTILRCAFSYDADVQANADQPIVRLTQEGVQLTLKRCFNPFYWPEIIWWLSSAGRRYRTVGKQYNEISQKIISARKRELEQSDDAGKMEEKKHYDFLEILLKARDEDGNGLTEEEIRAEVNIFLFAGHDTTSSAISWTLYQLGNYPEHQAKCRAEIEEIMKGRDGEDEMECEDISKLNYLTMCIKETMRMYTTVPMISRYTSRELEIEGHVIPKGMLVNVMLFVIHRQPDVWEDPDTFRPERFLPDEVAKRDTYAFVPFSAGPRNCIGQNFALNGMKVVLSKLIRNFKIGVDKTRPPRRLPEGVLRSENGIWLTFEPVRGD